MIEQPRKSTKPPQFLVKLFQIVNNPAFDYVVCWDASGEKIIIKNAKVFEDKVMKIYFKMAALSSFKR